MSNKENKDKNFDTKLAAEEELDSKTALEEFEKSEEESKKKAAARRRTPNRSRLAWSFLIPNYEFRISN